MALDCCLGGSRRILRRHGATSTTGFWLPRRQRRERRRRGCPVPTGTANFGPIGRPAQAINDAGKHSRKKTIKMMMEQTNSAEGPSINNVRPFFHHISASQNSSGSCQKNTRHLSSNHLSIIKQLSF